MFVCRGCGVEQKGRTDRVFCSMACQREDQRGSLVDEWLRTGIGRPDSRRNHYIRTFLFAEQNGLCAMCAADAEWCGQPLAFVLDHANGNSADNRRENLRLVCPNCDSQLPTYKNRNAGRGRYSRRIRYSEGRSY